MIYLEIPANPNCDGLDGQVFQCQSGARVITHVRWNRSGVETWCEVTGIDEGGAATPAKACDIEDSGDGMCHLVTGGSWGVRLKEESNAATWSLDDPKQWGEPFLLIPADGQSVRFV